MTSACFAWQLLFLRETTTAFGEKRTAAGNGFGVHNVKKVQPFSTFVSCFADLGLHWLASSNSSSLKRNRHPLRTRSLLPSLARLLAGRPAQHLQGVGRPQDDSAPLQRKRQPNLRRLATLLCKAIFNWNVIYVCRAFVTFVSTAIPDILNGFPPCPALLPPGIAACPARSRVQRKVGTETR